MDQLLPFALFAFVASITPGPTNILVLSHSSRFGLATTLPIILGACAAAALLVLLVGTGLGDVLARHATLQTLLSWAGIARPSTLNDPLRVCVLAWRGRPVCSWSIPRPG